METNKNVPISQYANVPIFGRLFACILFSILFINSSKACQCNTITTQESYNESDLVFVGKVIQIDTIYNTYYVDNKERVEPSTLIVTLIPSGYYKGKETKKYKVRTTVGSGACGVYFKLDQEFLVYAYKTKKWFDYDSRKNIYVTNYCIGTKKLSKITDKELIELSKLKNKN